MTAGSVVEETGTRDIEKMGGLVKRMPFTAGLFLIGAISISALPPLNGFVSELMIFQAFFQSFVITNPYVIILLFICLSLFALTSALAAACFVKAFGIIFLAMPRSEKARNAQEVSRYMLIGPAILALFCIFPGGIFFPDFPVPGLYSAYSQSPDYLLDFAGVYGYHTVRDVQAGQPQKPDFRYLVLRLPAPDSQTEYTASGFSEPILTFFKPIYRTEKSIERNFWDKQVKHL